jgi:hypothetical protein
MRARIFIAAGGLLIGSPGQACCAYFLGRKIDQINGLLATRSFAGRLSGKTVRSIDLPPKIASRLECRGTFAEISAVKMFSRGRRTDSGNGSESISRGKIPTVLRSACSL